MRVVISLLIGAVSASAVLAEPSAPGTINVIGRKPDEMRKEAQDYVRLTRVAERPIARWVEPICPHTSGIAPDIAKRVDDRIRDVARQAAVRVAPEPCRTNIVVRFASDGGALVRAIAAKAPGRLVEVAAEDRPALLNGAAPIRWWHATETRTSQGMSSVGDDAPPSVMSDVPGGWQLPGEVYLQYRSGIVSSQVVRVLRGATVIVDANRAAGKTLDSVADFAALISLAELRANDEAPRSSILSLFQAGGARSLSALDLNFLGTLYRLPLDRTAAAQRGLLVKALVAGPEKHRED